MMTAANPQSKALLVEENIERLIGRSGPQAISEMNADTTTSGRLAAKGFTSVRHVANNARFYSLSI